MPPPRKLPQRSWAASIPTILTHSKLHVLLLPSPMPCPVPGLAGSYLCSPLERFLGSVIMRRHLQRIIQLEPNVSQKLLTCYNPSEWWDSAYTLYLHHSWLPSFHSSLLWTLMNRASSCLKLKCLNVEWLSTPKPTRLCSWKSHQKTQDPGHRRSSRSWRSSLRPGYEINSLHQLINNHEGEIASCSVCI